MTKYKFSNKFSKSGMTALNKLRVMDREILSASHDPLLKLRTAQQGYGGRVGSSG